jgi:hypothetical protein
VGAPYSPGMTDTTGSGTVELDQEFLPLKMLAHVLTAVLATEIVLAAARLVVPLLARGDSPRQAGTDSAPVVVLSRVGLVATVILFLVWFRRARINAERSSWRQRRARAWAFWGGSSHRRPVDSLQIMGDIWRAGLPPQPAEPDCLAARVLVGKLAGYRAAVTDWGQPAIEADRLLAAAPA